jgi:hypothetical protein
MIIRAPLFLHIRTAHLIFFDNAVTTLHWTAFFSTFPLLSERQAHLFWQLATNRTIIFEASFSLGVSNFGSDRTDAA